MAFVVLLGDISVAAAQNRDPIGSFFRSLFGIERQRPHRRALPPQNKPRRGASAGANTARARAVPIAPKDDDARVIRVIGDTQAAGLKRGLNVAFADVSSVKVEGLDKGNSGLARYDRFNWPDEIQKRIFDVDARTDAVIVLIGVNDRQDIRLEEQRLKLFSDEWMTTYRQRVVDLNNLFLSRGVRVYWVGLAPTSGSKMTSDFAALNEIYREGAVETRSAFVDIWTPFLNPETGNYSAYGPDVDGNRRKLRASDGIHFTRAGYRKIAFFVERDLRRDFVRGGYSSAVPSEFQIDPMKQVDEELKTGMSRVVVLTGRPPAPSTLAGDIADKIELRSDTQYQSIIIEGKPLAPQSGRADDFRWPLGAKRFGDAAAADPPPTAPATVAAPSIAE